MQPPSDFRLEPVDLKKKPMTTPPNFVRHQLFDDSSIFTKIDEHAIQVSKREHRSLRDLLYDLIYRHKQLQELEKLRAIFRWLTAKDLTRIEFADARHDGPEQVLLLFKKKKSTFARIFETLCQYSGLYCATIVGFAKGVDFRVGHKFAGSGPNRPLMHSWNAVYVGDQHTGPDGNKEVIGWQLIDAHWAARYMPCADKLVADAYTGLPLGEEATKGKGENWSMVYELDEHYFLMEPRQAVYSHMPRDPDADWQLLPPAERATLAQFEEWPLVKSQFFKCGMDLLRETNGTLKPNQGRLGLALGFWKPSSIFTYKLQFLRLAGANQKGPARLEDAIAVRYKDDGDKLTDPIDLRRFVLQEIELAEGHLNYFLRLPTAGTYYLTVYAALIDPTIADRGGSPSETMFRAALEYRIVSDDGTTPTPFPNCHDQLWGSSLAASIFYGLCVGPTPSTRPHGALDEDMQNGGADAPFSVGWDRARLRANSEGVAIIRFLRVGPTGNDTRLLSKLIRRPPWGVDPSTISISEYDLDRYVSCEEIGDAIVYTIHLPEPGEYAIEFYANLPNRDEDTYWHLCQYLINFQPPHMMMDRGYPDQNDSDPTMKVVANIFKIDEDPASFDPRRPLPSFYTKNYFNESYPPLPFHSYGYDKVNAHGPLGSGYLPDGASGVEEDALKALREKRLYSPTTGWQPDESASKNEPVEEGLMHSKRSAASQSAPRRGAPTSERNDGSAEERLVSPLDFYQPELSKANWNAAPEVLRQAPEAFNLEKINPDSAPKPTAVIDLDPDAVISTEEEEALAGHRPTDEQLYRTFQRVDTHAIECARIEYRSFRDLIWSLIFARQITDDLEKLRAIFLWLCSKDLSKMQFETAPTAGSPEELLLGIKTGRSTYAQVFELLCNYAGLYCTILTGRAKGAEYEPGMKFVGKLGSHTWNAVYVNGAWRLIDCHWAARRLTGKHATFENVRYELDLFYFMPSPAHLAYSHNPDQPEWQLLRQPITIDQFEGLPPAKSTFFKYGLWFLSHRHAVIEWPPQVGAPSNDLQIRLGFPAWRQGQLAFIATLAFENGQEDLSGEKLTRWCYEEIVGNSTLIHVRFPQAGTYKLVIYAKEVEPEPIGNSADSAMVRESVYGAVCEYKLVASSASPNSLGQILERDLPPPPYPPCQNMHYGPLEASRRYQITPDRNECRILASNGYFEVRYTLPKSMRFMTKLRYSRASNQDKVPDDTQLERSILTRTVRDRELKLTGFLPAAGEYGLELYGNDPSVDGNTLYQIWQLLLVASTPSPMSGNLPTLQGSFLGPQSKFAASGLVPISHVDPYVHLVLGSPQLAGSTGSSASEVNFLFGAKTTLRITVQLVFTGAGPSAPAEDLSTYVLHQSRNKENQIEFCVRLPRIGFYKLQIFALPSGESNESLPNVFNYLIELAAPENQPIATGSQLPDVLPFPKQFAQWKDSCYLHEPLSGLLRREDVLGPTSPTGDQMRFRLQIPKAQAVSVVCGEEWFALNNRGEGLWATEIDPAPLFAALGAGKRTKLSVCANFAAIKASYSTLLEYALQG